MMTTTANAATSAVAFELMDDVPDPSRQTILAELIGPPCRSKYASHTRPQRSRFYAEKSARAGDG
jgi:hypothetical protein